MIHAIVPLSHLWCREMAAAQPKSAEIAQVLDLPIRKLIHLKLWPFLLLRPRWKALQVFVDGLALKPNPALSVWPSTKLNCDAGQELFRISSFRETHS